MKSNTSSRAKHFFTDWASSYCIVSPSIPHARAVLVGYPTQDTSLFLPYIQTLNVEVLCWEDKEETREHIQETEPKTPPMQDMRQVEATHFPSFHWKVACLAQAQGYKNVPALAARMGLRRQSVYGLWNGETIQVSLDALERLCQALSVAPGDWFVWIGNKDTERRLQWAVATAATMRGLKISTLSLKAEVHMRSLRPIWLGQAQAVSIDTLARLAFVLDAIKPFAIGDLFAWADAK